MYRKTIESIVQDLHLGKGGIFARIGVPDPEFPSTVDRITIQGEGLKLGQEITVTIEAHND